MTTIYQRIDPVAPAANLDRAKLGRLLAGSLWARLGSREQIRFVDPPSADHFAQPPGQGRDRSIRSVTIDLVRDRSMLFVVLDGELYTVAACELPRAAGPRVMTTCLEHRDDGGSYGGQSYGGAGYGGRNR